MDKVVTIEVSTDTVIDLMLTISDRIETNKKRIRRNYRKPEMRANVDRYREINRNLKKIYKGLTGVNPILIEEVY